MEKNEKTVLLQHGDASSRVKYQGGYPIDWNVKGVPVVFPEQIMEINGQSKQRGGPPTCSPHWANWPGKYNVGRQHGYLRDTKMGYLGGEANSALFGFSGLPSDISKSDYPWLLDHMVGTKIENNTLEMELSISRENDEVKEPVQVLPAIHTYLNSPNGAILSLGGKSYDFQDRAKWLPMTGETYVEMPGLGTVFIKATSEHSEMGQLQPYLARWSDNPNRYSCPEVIFENPDDFKQGKGISLQLRQWITLWMHLTFIPFEK